MTSLENVSFKFPLQKVSSKMAFENGTNKTSLENVVVTRPSLDNVTSRTPLLMDASLDNDVRMTISTLENGETSTKTKDNNKYVMI